MTESTILQALYPWSSSINPDEVNMDDVLTIRINNPCINCLYTNDCVGHCEGRIEWEQELQS